MSPKSAVANSNSSPAAAACEGVSNALVVWEITEEASHQREVGAVTLRRLGERTVQHETRLARLSAEHMAREQGEAAGARGVRTRRTHHDGTDLVK